MTDEQFRLIERPSLHDDPEAWHRIRQAGIGGSDVPAILGIDRFRTPLRVYLEKTGEIDPAAERPSDPALWGSRLEPLVAAHFRRERNARLRILRAVLQSTRWPFMQANLDRAIDEATIGGKRRKNGILEVKVRFSHYENWTDAPPDSVLAQVHHYLAVTGWEWAVVAAVVGGRYIEYVVERDDDIVHWLAEIEAAFWWRVVHRIPPEPDGSKSTTEFIRSRFSQAIQDKTIELPADTAIQALKDYWQAKAAAEEAEERLAAAENRLKLLMGDAEVGLLDGRPAIKWPNVRNTVFDREAFQQAYPGVYEQFIVEGKPKRRFMVVWNPDEA